MDTIFTNSKKSKTPEPHRLLLNLQDRIDLVINRKLINMLPYLSLSLNIIYNIE